jgi:hypothetical protein
MIITDRALCDFLNDQRKRSSWLFVLCEFTPIIIMKPWSLSSQFGQIVRMISFCSSPGTVTMTVDWVAPSDLLWQFLQRVVPSRHTESTDLANWAAKSRSWKLGNIDLSSESLARSDGKFNQNLSECRNELKRARIRYQFRAIRIDIACWSHFDNCDRRYLMSEDKNGVGRIGTFGIVSWSAFKK